MQLLRITKHTLKHNNITIVSDELRSDRARAALLKVGDQVDGNVSFEFSADTFDKFLECAVTGAFSSGVLKSGAAALRSFAFEDGALDIGQFIYLFGCNVGDLNLNVTARQIITGDFSLLGTVGQIASATAATTTVARTTTPVMAAGVNVASMILNGAALGVGIKELKLNIKGNLRTREVIDSTRMKQPGRGDNDITGTMTGYWQDASLWSLFKANTPFALGWTFTDVVSTGKKYDFVIPKCYFTGDVPDLTGINNDRMENVEFRAVIDPVTSCQLQVTKSTIP
jgi:hypothetical protein